MAVYKIFPTQDATIYSAYPNQNTGLDEILDASTNFLTGSVQINGDLPQTSRFLIQFDDSDIAYVTQSLIKNKPWDAYLKVFVANSTYLQTNTTILANAVSKSASVIPAISIAILVFCFCYVNSINNFK